MANKHRGEVELTIGGESKRLRFDMQALAELEEALGLESIAELGKRLDNPSIKLARAVLWAGLLHTEPELTLKAVGEPEGSFVQWWPKIVAAVLLALFGSGTAPEADATKKKTGTASASPPPTDSPPDSASPNGSSGS